MGRLGTIGRRTFLIGSVAVAGGVAFGLYNFVKGAPNPLASDDEMISLNAFVRSCLFVNKGMEPLNLEFSF